MNFFFHIDINKSSRLSIKIVERGATALNKTAQLTMITNQYHSFVYLPTNPTRYILMLHSPYEIIENNI